MVTLNKLYGLFAFVAVSNVWTGVHGQSEEPGMSIVLFLFWICCLYYSLTALLI